MKKNSDTKSSEDPLPSADMRATGFIIFIFVLSMTLMTRIFAPVAFNNQSHTDYVLGKQPRISDEEHLQKLSKKELTTPTKPKELTNATKPKNVPKASHIRFPPFKGKKGEHVYHPIIQKASSQNDLEPALVKAVIMAESGYNPEAVSPVGAMGLMQLMPGTAESLGVQNGFNPEQNIQAGTRYLKKLIDRLDGDISLALAAYNAGLRHVLNYNGIPPFKATEHYIHKVFHYYDFYKNQENVQARQDMKKDTNEQSVEKTEEA
ncbi:MAG: lytic transglycosylase domain-containing protein [Desulfobacterales bacterium]